MTIRYQCPDCDATLKIKDELAGRPGKCPQCHAAFTIPDAPGSDDHLSLDDDSSDDERAKKSPVKSKRRVHDDEHVTASAPEPPAGDSSAIIAMNFLKHADSAAMELEERPSKASGGKKKGKGVVASASEYDLAATARNYAITILPRVAIAGVLVYFAYWISSSLTSGGVARPPLGTVSGIVTLDGAPLANAAIVFQPEEGMESGVRIPESIGRTGADGRYSMIYVQGVLGAAIGTHRVKISATDDKGDEKLPVNYNRKSELMAQVSAGDNNIDFPLKSK